MSDNQSPLHQFEIRSIVPVEWNGLDLSFTNSSLWMVSVIGAVLLFFVLGMRRRALIPGYWQSLVEIVFEFVGGILQENTGSQGRKYFPFVFSLFLFVFGCNLFGMLPYSFTVTSHIAVTFALAALVFVTVTIVALCRHGWHFFSFFLPHGTPWWLAPIMIVIELFAYLARPVSLSIRLAANMVAGHVLLKVIAGFVVAMGIVWGAFPMPVILLLTGFEIFIAFLQAYIFTILTCVYLNDAIHLH
jgi:F-type H+-transporting ATPase subunit a